MRAFLASAAIVVALTTFAAPANAALKSFAVESVSPADGGTIGSTYSLPLSLKSAQAAAAFSGPSGPSIMFVEVATLPTLGQDGTLAQEFTVGSSSLTRGDAFPDTFNGSVLTYPQLTGGTFYWQAHYTQVETAPPPTYSEINTYTSPIFRFVIGTPAAPPPQPPASSPGPSPGPGPSTYFTLGSAKATARAIIRDETGRRPHHLKQRCRRRSRSTFTCNVTWFTTRVLRRSTWIYSGNLRMQDVGEDVLYSFSGLRAKEGCLRRGSVRRCARRVRW